MTTIKELLDRGYAFMGSDWVKDDSVNGGAFPGYRYNGEIPCVICNDIFLWGCSDGEEITNQDIPTFNQALMDCNLDINMASILFCCRKRKMRPQGAVYEIIPKNLRCLFDKCGPVRDVGMGNPHSQYEYK